MGDRRPDFRQVLDDAVESGIVDVYKLIPAKVVKWDAATGRANCQILVKQARTDEEGNRIVVSLPVVTGVPVLFPGSGIFRITFPIYDGTDGEHASTLGLLQFSHRSLDKWLTGTGEEVDPEFDHAHALTDAVFLPGLKPFGAPWQYVSTSKLTIGRDDPSFNDFNPTDIEIDENGNVHLGPAGSAAAARVDDQCSIDGGGNLATWMSQVEAFINGLAAGTVTPLAGTFVASPGIQIASGSANVSIG